MQFLGQGPVAWDAYGAIFLYVVNLYLVPGLGQVKVAQDFVALGALGVELEPVAQGDQVELL